VQNSLDGETRGSPYNRAEYSTGNGAAEAPDSKEIAGRGKPIERQSRGAKENIFRSLGTPL
jgi:hypothetical protein